MFCCDSRFSPTRPPTHWTGVRQSFSPGPACPQVFPKILSNASEALLRMPRQRYAYLKTTQARLEARQSEDCLYMNIYAPSESKPSEKVSPNLRESNGLCFAADSGRSSSLSPVLVFVHGESFSWGSGNLYDGRVLAAYGKVVVVTFNFRLGIFGNFINENKCTFIVLRS